MRLPDIRAGALDAGIALALFTLAAAEALLGSPGLGRGAALLAAGAYTLPLTVRRRFPLVSGAAVLAMQVLLGAVAPDGNQVTIIPAAMLAVYSLGRHLPPRVADAAFAVWLLVFTTVIAAGTVPSGSPVVEATTAGLIMLVPWATGRARRAHAVRVDGLTREADELRRDRDRRTHDAVAAERARLARELHDVVTHAISVVAVQTQAVRLRLEPTQAREAEDLRGVESAARDAMGELRRLLGVLRSDGDDPPLEPQPGLEQLPRLVERARAAGADVEVVVDGPPVALSPGVDLTAYRVLQEGVTNALRHAPGSPIAISVRYGPELGLRVANATVAGAPVSPGAGVGLTGMRERVALYGGWVDAREHLEGGFRLAVGIPLAAQSA